MKFRYTYKTTKGTTEKGIVEAENRFAVYDIVRKDGGSIVSVEEATSGLASIDMTNINAMISRVKIPEQVLLARNLGAMLSAGLTVSRAINVLNRQTRNPRLKQTLQGLGTDIQQGGDLHSAMQKYPKVFPRLMVAMTRAGEESGKLSESLQVTAAQMESVYELQKKIKGALIYPGIILTALIGIGIIMMMTVVPTLSGTFEDLGVDLPASTRAVIGISNFLINYTILAFGILLAAIVGFIYSLRTKVGKRVFDTVVLYIPLIKGVVKESNSAKASRTMASLLSSGVSVVQAFEITEDIVSNSHFKKVLHEAGEKVQKGIAVSSVFQENENLYPPLVGEMIAVGEETGKLPDMFEELAKFYEGEVEQKTKNMSTFIEPFLMLIVGGAVGFFAVSMLSPIYGITQAF